LDKEQKETPYSRNNCMAFYNLRIKTLLYYVQINVRNKIKGGVRLFHFLVHTGSTSFLSLFENKIKLKVAPC